MTNERKIQIVEALEAYLKDHGLSQNEAARVLPPSAGTLSKMRTGAKSPELREKMWAKIDDMMWQKLMSALPGSVQVLETRQYQAAFVGLMDAKRGHSSKVIDGSVGMGKTFTVSQFAKQHPAETFRVRCNRDMSAKSFLQAVALAVGVSDQGTAETIRIGIGEKLSRASYPLLIIDEAENLKDLAYGSIKALYDDLHDENKSGIVLVGANNYAETLRRKARRNVGCFPQIWSRFKADRVVLPEMELADVAYVCDAYGISEKPQIVKLSGECEDYRDLFGTIKAYLRDAQYTDM